MIAEGKSVPVSKKESYLAAFQDLSKYKTITGNNETIYLTADIATDFDVEDIDDEWLDGKKKELKIPDDMIELLDKVRNTLDDKKLYERITIGDDIVYLLYWNLLGAGEFNIWQCIPLICKDCGIDINDTLQEIQDRHILYIHDVEWGNEENRLLMKNSEQKEKDDILTSLKDYFQYIATFQHTNFEGLHFNNILNCRFGEDAIADKLGELEDDETIKDYIRLKHEMKKIL